ncbi:hypothetical protein AGMMS49975_16330 [Clostridia bacterium]|nr:hypothetical protein AGMMS49975_16330 [Clostridia bacterium]
MGIKRTIFFILVIYLLVSVPVYGDDTIFGNAIDRIKSDFKLGMEDSEFSITENKHVYLLVDVSNSTSSVNERFKDFIKQLKKHDFFKENDKITYIPFADEVLSGKEQDYVYPGEFDELQLEIAKDRKGTDLYKAIEFAMREIGNDTANDPSENLPSIILLLSDRKDTNDKGGNPYVSDDYNRYEYFNLESSIFKNLQEKKGEFGYIPTWLVSEPKGTDTVSNYDSNSDLDSDNYSTAVYLSVWYQKTYGTIHRTTQKIDQDTINKVFFKIERDAGVDYKFHLAASEEGLRNKNDERTLWMGVDIKDTDMEHSGFQYAIPLERIKAIKDYKANIVDNKINIYYYITALGEDDNLDTDNLYYRNFEIDDSKIYTPQGQIWLFFQNHFTETVIGLLMVIVFIAIRAIFYNISFKYKVKIYEIIDKYSGIALGNFGNIVVFKNKLIIIDTNLGFSKRIRMQYTESTLDKVLMKPCRLFETDSPKPSPEGEIEREIKIRRGKTDINVCTNVNDTWFNLEIKNTFWGILKAQLNSEGFEKFTKSTKTHDDRESKSLCYVKLTARDNYFEVYLERL